MQNDEEDVVEATIAIEPQPARRPLVGYEITQPIIVHSRADIASLLRAHRISRDWTCEEMDARAGFSDRYVTKLENGDVHTGGRRQGIHIEEPKSDCPKRGQDFSGVLRTTFSTELWFETLGLALVILPVELAQSIGAVKAPAKVVGK